MRLASFLLTKPRDKPIKIEAATRGYADLQRRLITSDGIAPMTENSIRGTLHSGKMAWRCIKSAPRDGTPILLFLNPPLDTNDVVGWLPSMHMSFVVGWATGFGNYIDPDYGRWQCGMCYEGSADTEGYCSALLIDVYPTHWLPLPSDPSDS